MANRVTIEQEICKGCGLCVVSCPKSVLETDSGTLNAKGYNPARVRDISACIACAMCALICPDSAIKVEKED